MNKASPIQNEVFKEEIKIGNTTFRSFGEPVKENEMKHIAKSYYNSELSIMIIHLVNNNNGKHHYQFCRKTGFDYFVDIPELNLKSINDIKEEELNLILLKYASI